MRAHLSLYNCQLSSSVLALLARSKSSTSFPNPVLMPRSQRRTSDRATAEELARRATDMAFAETTAKAVDGSAKRTTGTSLKMHNVVVGS